MYSVYDEFVKNCEKQKGGKWKQRNDVLCAWLMALEDDVRTQVDAGHDHELTDYRSVVDQLDTSVDLIKGGYVFPNDVWRKILSYHHGVVYSLRNCVHLNWALGNSYHLEMLLRLLVEYYGDLNTRTEFNAVDQDVIVGQSFYNRIFNDAVIYDLTLLALQTMPEQILSDAFLRATAQGYRLGTQLNNFKRVESARPRDIVGSNLELSKLMDTATAGSRTWQESDGKSYFASEGILHGVIQRRRLTLELKSTFLGLLISCKIGYADAVTRERGRNLFDQGFELLADPLVEKTRHFFSNPYDNWLEHWYTHSFYGISTFLFWFTLCIVLTLLDSYNVVKAQTVVRLPMIMIKFVIRWISRAVWLVVYKLSYPLRICYRFAVNVKTFLQIRYGNPRQVFYDWFSPVFKVKQEIVDPDDGSEGTCQFKRVIFNGRVTYDFILGNDIFKCEGVSRGNGLEMSIPGSDMRPSALRQVGAILVETEPGELSIVGHFWRYKDFLVTAEHVAAVVSSGTYRVHLGVPVEKKNRTYCESKWSTEPSEFCNDTNQFTAGHDIFVKQYSPQFWAQLGISQLSVKKNSCYNQKITVSGYKDGMLFTSFGDTMENSGPVDLYHLASTMNGWSGTPLFNGNSVVGMHTGRTFSCNRAVRIEFIKSNVWGDESNIPKIKQIEDDWKFQGRSVRVERVNNKYAIMSSDGSVIHGLSREEIESEFPLFGERERPSRKRGRKSAWNPPTHIFNPAATTTTKGEKLWADYSDEDSDPEDYWESAKLFTRQKGKLPSPLRIDTKRELGNVQTPSSSKIVAPAIAGEIVEKKVERKLDTPVVTPSRKVKNKKKNSTPVTTPNKKKQNAGKHNPGVTNENAEIPSKRELNIPGMRLAERLRPVHNNSSPKEQPQICQALDIMEDRLKNLGYNKEEYIFPDVTPEREYQSVVNHLKLFHERELLYTRKVTQAEEVRCAHLILERMRANRFVAPLDYKSRKSILRVLESSAVKDCKSAGQPYQSDGLPTNEQVIKKYTKDGLVDVVLREWDELGVQIKQFIKTEPTKVKKIQKDMPRIVQGLPLHKMMKHQAVFGEMLTAAVENWKNSPIVYAFSPGNPGHVEHLASLFPGSVYESDKSNWDFMVFEYVWNVLTHVVRGICVQASMSDVEFEQYCKDMTSCIRDVCVEAKLRCSNGEVIERKDWVTMISGFLLTIFGNSTGQVVVDTLIKMRLGWNNARILHPDNRIVAGGDDVLQAFDSEFESDPQNLVDYIAEARDLGIPVELKRNESFDGIEFFSNRLYKKDGVWQFEPVRFSKHISKLRRIKWEHLPGALSSYMQEYCWNEEKYKVFSDLFFQFRKINSDLFGLQHYEPMQFLRNKCRGLESSQ